MIEAMSFVVSWQGLCPRPTIQYTARPAMSASNYLCAKGSSDAFAWGIAWTTLGLGALLGPLAIGKLRRA
jgi:hypothetical protein